MQPLKILIIATSHSQMDGTSRKTGLWLEEIAAPYYIFKDAGMLVTLASPKGGKIPLDPKSESIIVSNAVIKRFQKDAEALLFLSNSLIIDTQNADDFDIVFLTGGHGAVYDYYANDSLRHLLENFNTQKKLIGAVSHGATAFLNLENKVGEPLVKGKQLTAFSNTEEQSSGLTDILPFLLESKLFSLGVFYSKRPDFVSHVVVDENFVTGQNAASAKEVANKLLARFKELPKRMEAVMH